MADAIPSPPLPKAKSSTFAIPPFKDAPTLPEIFAFHAVNSPQHPVFAHPGDSPGAIRQILYPEVYAAIQRSHGIVSRHHSALSGDAAESPIVGILANLDTITYITLLLGTMHAGLTPFAISTRNSVEGVAHLIRTTGTRILFVSPDPAMQRLATEACAKLKDEGITVTITPAPQFGDFYNDDNSFKNLSPVKKTPDPVIIILHSSGSTAQPKPISMRNRNFMQWGCLPYYGEIDLAGSKIAVHALPTFHAMGFLIIGWMACAGSITVVFKPASPPTIPTPDVFLSEIVATKSKIVFCVPAFVEAWARSPKNIDILRNLDSLIYGGAPVSRGTGDQLVKAGVNLTPFYGITETGCFTTFMRGSPNLDHWRYFKVSPHCEIHLEPYGTVEEGELAELFLLDSKTASPNVLNTTVNGRPAYATGDLVLVHPIERDRLYVYGRADDQIVLSTGEKTNPVVLESLFSQDKNITSAVMFGFGRFQCGVLVQPAVAFDPEDEQKLAAFRNLIWPTVEKVNNVAPEHARIFKEMIVTTYPKRPLELTPKGTPRRQLCLRAYQKEIDGLYEAVKETSQADIPIPESWTKESAAQFVESAIRRVIKHPIAVDDDIFLQGCDSLQATWIRNSILHAVRSSKSNASVHKIPLDIVYTNPNILALGNYFWQVLSGSTVENSRQDRATRIKASCAEMESLVNKYTAAIPRPAWTTSSKPSREETVLLTGSTGRLGCHILKQLADRQDVLKVYALNRPSALGLSSQERQREALKNWDLDINLDAFKKIVFLEYNPSESKLGLSEEVYLELQATVTTIIHNGWRVDFNIGLRSYENLIAGTRHLLDLAVGSSVPNGPKFIFASSVSVFKNLGDKELAPESSVPASMAAGFGYGEGKWVTENVCQKVSEVTGLSLSIIRIGQMSGNASGRWNVKEWVPALVKLGKVIGNLPSRDEPVTWLPVDTAATAILDILKKSPSPMYLNLVHPRPIAWNDVFKATADHLQLGFISYEEWVKQLHAKRDTIVRQNKEASADLTDFFLRGQFVDGTYVMDATLETCPTLKDLKPLDTSHVIKSLPFWNI